jgi:hypothetical protein
MVERYKNALDSRISAALSNGAAIDDENLVQDIEWSIEQSARIAEQERELSLDPTTSSSEAEQASQRAALAELKRDRYKAALPRIQKKFAAAERSAALAKFSGDADEVAAWVAAAEKKLASTYSTCATQIAAALKEAEAANQEVDRVNGAAPDGINRRISRVDLKHLKDLVLPDAEHRGRKLWPPRRPITLFGDPASLDERDRADMVKSQQRALADAIASERERPQRIAAQFEQLTREQEERWNREERERVALLRRQ